MRHSHALYLQMTFLTLMAIILAVATSAGAATSRRANIIFIMADDLGYNELGSYGQRIYPTPHTDRLAREGMRFTDAHSPNAVCSPTRYAVVTGTDPYRRYETSHVLFNGEALVIRKGEATVASLLQQNGYRTGIVGKWHLGLGDVLPRDLNKPGRGPNDIGFDYSYIIPDGPDMSPHYYLEDGQIEGAKDPRYESKPSITRRVGYQLVSNTMVGTWENRRPGDGIGARLADKAIAFIEANMDRPFFLYYPTCAIHLPLKPDPRFVGKSGIGPRGDYVMEFDWAVGRIMETIERLGLANNTLLIVTSDNGGQPNAGRRDDAEPKPNHPWRGGKGDAWEGGHRIPFLARWIGRIKAASTSSETISLVDLTATACGLAGVPLSAAAALDSFNLLPVLLGETNGQPIRPYTVMGTRGIEQLVLRQGPWKLIHTPGKDKSQLFHLGDDPGETTDLAPAQAKQTRAMRDVLIHYIESGSSRPHAKGQGKSITALFAERDERNRLVEARFEHAGRK